MYLIDQCNKMTFYNLIGQAMCEYMLYRCLQTKPSSLILSFLAEIQKLQQFSFPSFSQPIQIWSKNSERM